MKDTLLAVGLVLVILVASAVITHLFAKTMYTRCTKCGTLNAKRRSQCRACDEPIR